MKTNYNFYIKSFINEYIKEAEEDFNLKTEMEFLRYQEELLYCMHNGSLKSIIEDSERNTPERSMKRVAQDHKELNEAIQLIIYMMDIHYYGRQAEEMINNPNEITFFKYAS